MTKLDPSKAGIPELLEKYREAALAHRAASRAGNHKVANKAFERLATIVRELRGRGLEAQMELLSLLNDEHIGVRGWAAAHALEFAPQQAESVLEQLASGPSSLEEFSAKLVLQQWRGGAFRFP